MARTTPWEHGSDRPLIYFSAARQVLFFTVVYFFCVPRFAETTKINFGFVCRQGIERDAHPHLAGRFITLPCQEIHNKISFILFDDERTTKLIDFFFFIFLYLFIFVQY